MSEAELRQWLREAMARLLSAPIETIDEDAEFDSFGLPSLEAVMLTGELEDRLGRPVDANSLYDYPTIASLAAALAQACAHV